MGALSATVTHLLPKRSTGFDEATTGSFFVYNSYFRAAGNTARTAPTLMPR